MKKRYVISIATTAALLSGCMTTEGYKQEYKQASGIDLSQRSHAVDCSDLYENISFMKPELYKAAQTKCAERNSGKSFVSDQVLRYSELAGGYESSCFFGGYDRTLILDRISKGVGLVQPVLMYGSDGEIFFDRLSTERLIRQLTIVMKLKVKPMADTEAYYNALIKRSDETAIVPQKNVSLVALFNQSKKSDEQQTPVNGSDHYKYVVSKLSQVDYIVEASQDIVDAIISGSAVRFQQQLKLLAPKADPSLNEKKTFKPSEIQDMARFSSNLEYIIQQNAADIRLGFDLVERMKSFNENEQSFMQRTIANSVERGCAIKDIDKNFAQTQIANVKDESEIKKSFGQQLTEMIQVDTSNGFSLGLSNENLLRDQFKSQRTRLMALKDSYQKSMNERHQKVSAALVPFTGKAFQKFQITGHTESKKL